MWKGVFAVICVENETIAGKVTSGEPGIGLDISRKLLAACFGGTLGNCRSKRDFPHRSTYSGSVLTLFFVCCCTRGSAVLRYVVNVPSVVLRHFHRMFHMDAFYGSAFFYGHTYG